MKRQKDRLHRVMVIGATPAGISATNKLGELGIPVTLVDSDPDLDKKLSADEWSLKSGLTLNYAFRPGLIRILRNPRIKCILPGEITSIKHNMQGFRVGIKPGQTYVKPDRCVLCGRCEMVCPVHFEDGKKAIRAKNRMSLPGRAIVDKRRKPLCQENCPLGVNVQGYVALTKEGKYAEALELIRENNILPSICGRICSHPCEAACRRAEIDAPVSARSIKRFLADQEESFSTSLNSIKKEIKSKKEKIAVIGSGPSGLSAAAELSKNGFNVTVFEKEKMIGGLLRYGIGKHRLPREILEKEIDYIKGLGVKFQTSSPIDLEKDISKLEKNFNAIILSTGTWSDRMLGIPGEDLDGVNGCVEFLTDFYREGPKRLKGKTAVIGDGNSAFDLARTLVRVGTDVTLISWFPENMIPADDEEIKGAVDEGLCIQCSSQVVELTGENDVVSGVRIAPTKPGPKDAHGIPWPVIIEGEEMSQLNFDRVIIAVGQKGPLKKENGLDFNISERGTIQVDGTFKTNIKNLYASGDVVSGPSTVVEAMALGRLAAANIIYDITGEKPNFMNAETLPSRPPEKDFPQIPSEIKTLERAVVPELAPEKRSDNFQEVSIGLNESQIVLESERCLQCGVCSQCLQCLDECEEIGALNHSEPGEEIIEHTGVLIIADQKMSSQIRGEDVIRAYGPKAAKSDVYAMIIRGFSAAANAMELLSNTIQRPKGYGISFLSPDQGLSAEIKIGLFACKCNDSLGWVEDMDTYIQNLATKPDIVHAEIINTACLPATSAQILRTIREKGITRVVLASCICCPLNFVCSACTDQKSRLKEALFTATGISRSMVETCNLRDEALQLVENDPGKAFSKFKGLIDRSIERSKKLKSLPELARNYNFTTAVIGDSESSLNSAHILARSGFEVVLFNMNGISKEESLKHSSIHTINNVTVTEVGGTLGDFRVSFNLGDTCQTIQAGTIIMDEKARKTIPFSHQEDLPHFKIKAGIQKKGISGIPFFYPGSTSIPGLLLSDPPTVNVSKLKKGAAAAALAAAIMPRGPRQSRGFTVNIEPSTCRGCGRCLNVCPYLAISLKPNDIQGHYALVDEALCKGCGNCTSVCPSNAADSPYRNQAVFEEIIEEFLMQ